MTTLLLGGSGFIGSAIAGRFSELGIDYIVADMKKPDSKHPFTYLDLSSLEDTEAAFRAIGPHTVINLVARTDDAGKSIEDYSINYQGLLNTLSAMRSHLPGAKLVHFSTQYVLAPKYSGTNTRELHPYTVYGQSKAIAEVILRSTVDIPWLILRPTAVWGPHHPSYPNLLWPLMEKRLFTQPRVKVKRSYIYVETLVDQLLKILNSSDAETRGNTFYLGNHPSDPAELMDKFSIALTGRRARRAPLSLFKFPVLLDDLLGLADLHLPLSRVRLEVMSQDYLVDIKSTERVIGPTPENLSDAVMRTIEWYRSSR